MDMIEIEDREEPVGEHDEPDLEGLVRESAPDERVFLLDLQRRSNRTSMGDSLHHFLTGLAKHLNLDFGGVYVNHKIKKVTEVEHDGEQHYTVHDASEPRYGGVSADTFIFKPGRVITPIIHRGHKYGHVIFEKKEFSAEEVRLLNIAVNYFSTTVANCDRNESIINDLAKKAYRDQLTEVRNRHSLIDSGARLFHDAEVRGKPLSASVLDIDWFKQVNDQHGHGVGDRVLYEVAQIIANSVRVGDRVYRLGGEEFLILMPDTDIDETGKFNCRIKQKITAHFANKYRITVSCGVHSSTDCADLTQLIDRADEKLYKAKLCGRDAIYTGRSIDPLTGLKSTPEFEKEVARHKEMHQREGGNIAIFSLDIVNFSRFIDVMDDRAWHGFYDAAQTVFASRNLFSYVASFGNSDKMLLLTSSGNGIAEFDNSNMSKAKYIQSAVEGMSVNGWERYGEEYKHFTVAVGIVGYNVNTENNEETPAHLIGCANTLVRKAAKTPKRIMLEYHSK